MTKKFTLFIAVLCAAALFAGCGHANVRNLKADDDLTRAVYEAVGEDIYYLYKGEENGIIEYGFYVEHDNKESVRNFIENINASLDGKTEKVFVRLGCYLPGGYEHVMFICNYYDESAEKADLSGAANVTALYPDASEDELFSDPEIYTYFEDVRYFTIEEKLQNIAVDKGIDWYSVWDSLERFEVRDNKGNTVQSPSDGFA